MSTLKELLVARQRDYFTDREEAIRLFRDFTQTPVQNRLYRFMVIYGPGGIGKTMLAGKFRDICSDNCVGSSIANMDATNSPLDVLNVFRENCEPNHGNKLFRDFDSLIVKFNTIQAQLQGREKVDGKFSDVVAKVAGGVSSAAVGGAITGLALGPVGVLMAAAGGTLAKSVMQSSLATLLKNGLISSKDADFLVNLLPNLVSAFVYGMAELADAVHGIVLVFDGFEYAEKSRHLQEWITESLLPNLGDNAFVVILGRNKPQGKFWQTYSSFVYQYRLQPFDSLDIIKYLNIRGVDLNQSASLFNLTGGLPLGAALWVDVEVQRQTGLPGIISEQRSADVVNTVVDRLLENLDDGSKQTMRLCAILRWFDESTLELLMPHREADVIFEQLYKYSSLFRPDTSGLAMHNEVRRDLLDDFKSRNVKLYRDLNQKIAQYYEQKAQSEGKFGSLWFKYRIEHVYHLLASDSQEGFTLLNDIVNDVHEMGDSNILDDLLKIIASLPEYQRFYWTPYFEGEIHYFHQDFAQAKACLIDAAAFPFPQNILVRILVLLSLTLYKLDENLLALEYGKRALDVSKSINDRRCIVWLSETLGWVYHNMGNIDEALRTQERGLTLATELENKLDIGWALNGLGAMCRDCGDIYHAEELLTRALSIWKELGHIKGRFLTLFHLGQVYAETGRYTKAINYYNSALQSWPNSHSKIIVQAKLAEATSLLGENIQGVSILEKLREDAEKNEQLSIVSWTNLLLGGAYIRQGELEKAYICYTHANELSRKINFKYYSAKALVGILQLSYLKHTPLFEVQNAADNAEAASQENRHHNLLADVNLYRGLAQLREIIRTERNESVSDFELEISASTFYKAIVEALQFNSYTLDKTFDQLYEELMFLNIDIALKILERLIILWSSENLEDQRVIEFELSRRERDGLDNHRMPIIDRIKGKLAKNSE